MRAQARVKENLMNTGAWSDLGKGLTCNDNSLSIAFPLSPKVFLFPCFAIT